MIHIRLQINQIEVLESRTFTHIEKWFFYVYILFTKAVTLVFLSQVMKKKWIEIINLSTKVCHHMIKFDWINNAVLLLELKFNLHVINEKELIYFYFI